MSEQGLATAAARGPASGSAADVAPGSGLRTFGNILRIGGILFAISPLIAVAVGCRGTSDSSCGAGAIVMMVTLPIGGLVAAVGSILAARGNAKRIKAEAAARTQATTADGELAAPTAVEAARPTRPVPPLRVGHVLLSVAIALTLLGMYINPHRGAEASGFYAAVGPMDCWWLAALCAVVGTFIRQAHRRSDPPARFWGRTLTWCGVVVLSWSFLIMLLMGLGGGIGEYVNQAFDSGDLSDGFSPLGILTGTGSGPFASIFPGILVGSILISRGIKKGATA
ncbi:MAG: hypothetical protein KGP01_00265 [Actinomycetales bacterium]|nr:hypothetical protein [Actinomycetales bacterium]